MALELTLALLAFWFYTRPGQIGDMRHSLSFLVVQLTAVPRIVVVLVIREVMKKYCNLYH